ncbi:7739_t:CDS:2 [Diversispora eburnea]|uniref:7739_t:CDS:1 n=1 Tax=Diversispora eburnea TaxID=1213867 RepID=A0A9N8W712_9GLOM|nr:7739_t:CDS:2 [Diversispora eburnea]
MTWFCPFFQRNQGIKRSNKGNINRFLQKRVTVLEENVNNNIHESSFEDNKDIYINAMNFDEIVSNIYTKEFLQQSFYFFKTVTYSVPYGEVNAAMCFVKTLEQRRKNDNIFTKEYIQILNEFIDCIQNIKNYLAGISQLGRIRQYLKENSIGQMYKELSTEFDEYMRSLQTSFTFIIKYNFDAKNEEKIIANDERHLKKFFEHIKGGITDSTNKNVSEKIPQILEMNFDFQKQQRKLNVYSFRTLPFIDKNIYEEIEPGKKISKRLNKHSGEKVAFKEFTINYIKSNQIKNTKEKIGQVEYINDEKEIEKIEKDINYQVKILEYLRDSNHIIKFYGILKDGFKYFLINEWMDNGNLIEYYSKYPNISWDRKFDFALDICRGLSYLNAVKIFHYDLRGANILVDKNHNAKIAHFGLNQRFTEITRNIQPNTEIIRYMSPEKLLYGDKWDFDVKCEIYSFGALLWEIAEQKIPFSNEKDFQTIRDRIIKSNFEPLSSEVPEIWKNVVIKALCYIPKKRPPFSEIFNNLYEYKNPQRCSIESEIDDLDNEILDINTPINIPGYMNVQEAIDEHKKGNKEVAWKCFYEHADKGDMNAKFWVGYYHFNYDQSEIKELYNDKEENLIKAAQLFKESADSGNIEAQYWYGTCLWSGKGVKTNYNEALKYLTKAADEGYANAMYNVGIAYYKGVGVQQDKFKGTSYLRNAAKKNQIKAINICKNFEINY